MDISLLVTQYKFNDGLDLKEVNLFTKRENYEIIVAWDLFPALLESSLDNITTTIESIDSNNVLNYEASAINLKFSNLVPIYSAGTVSQYFKIYDNSIYDRYKLELQIDGVTKKTFIITTEDMKMIDREKEILEINAISIEKEFKEYYGSTPIPTFRSYQSIPLPNNLILQNFYSKNFFDVMRDDFFNSPFIDNIKLIGLKEIHLVQNAYFYHPVPKCENEILWCINGYIQFQAQGISLFDYFKSICLSMGWIFYFDNRTLIVRNRYDITSFPVKEIDFDDDVITHDIQTQVSDKYGDHVVIDDGEYWGEGNSLKAFHEDGIYHPYPYPTGTDNEFSLGGDRKIVISNTNTAIRNLQPIDFCAGIVDGKYALGFDLPFSVMINKEDDDYNFKFNIESYTGLNRFVQSKVTFPKSLAIEVKPVVNTRSYAAMLDYSLPRAHGSGDNYGNGNFFTYIVQPSGDTTFAYRGNAGNSLLIYDIDEDKILSYTNYIKTETFENNFKVLLKNKSQLIFRIEMIGILDVPNYVIQLKNYPYANLGDELFSIQKLETDYLNNKTTVTLCKLIENA